MARCYAADMLMALRLPRAQHYVTLRFEAFSLFFFRRFFSLLSYFAAMPFVTRTHHAFACGYATLPPSHATARFAATLLASLFLRHRYDAVTPFALATPFFFFSTMPLY